MPVNSRSPGITTAKVKQTRDFYVKHFFAKVNSEHP